MAHLGFGVRPVYMLAAQIIVALMPMVLFFFSSRRRHTRFDCDWSSDVCSSDLFIAAPPEQWWTGDSRLGLDVALGRAGATKRQYLRLGQGTSQHVLVAGKTG